MEPTDFEKWCAGELGNAPRYIMKQRKILESGEYSYMPMVIIEIRYRAYMAGVRSRLPYQHPAKQTLEE